MDQKSGLVEEREHTELKVFKKYYLLNKMKYSDLENPPKVENGKLDISNLGLTSLEGIPNGVTKLDCSHNQLTSLEGCPEGVSRWLYCHHNQLTTLEGIPNGVTYLNCSHNRLTSLEGSTERS